MITSMVTIVPSTYGLPNPLITLHVLATHLRNVRLPTLVQGAFPIRPVTNKQKPAGTDFDCSTLDKELEETFLE